MAASGPIPQSASKGDFMDALGLEKKDNAHHRALYLQMKVCSPLCTTICTLLTEVSWRHPRCTTHTLPTITTCVQNIVRNGIHLGAMADLRKHQSPRPSKESITTLPETLELYTSVAQQMRIIGLLSGCCTMSAGTGTSATRRSEIQLHCLQQQGFWKK